ncbi:MAG: acetate--CoA ligase [Deltaproteobacteria bacterium]|nr:acetate--CoA ligase [Deltaproteobacteria bacterium]
MSQGAGIDSILKENRVFAPPHEFAVASRVPSLERYQELYDLAERDPEAYWAGVALDLRWTKPWTQVLDWQPPSARWFDGAETNLSHNCLDRHLATRGNRAALIWEGEPGDARILTYQQLHRETCRFANVLLRLGVRQGDRVAIYLPMVPEAAIAMLACARIGAVHSVVFGGFSAEALRDRINDAGAKLVVTADGGYRRGKVVALKAAVDAAVERAPSVERVVVVRRTGDKVAMEPGRDSYWHELVEGVSDKHEAASLPAEHPLFILYTSGTTGKPKGIVHTTAGYMVGVYSTTQMVFDLKDNDTYWCTADVGWVTGHSYVVYGPLLNGATTVMYEGAPDFPEQDRLWKIIDKYDVTIFYTAPTAIRAFMRWGEQWPMRHDLASLRLLGTVGEPINPEAWMWYRQVIGGGRCPIVDTWWQTETGAIMCSPLPGATPTKPGSCTRPLPGIAMDVVTRDGTPVPPGQGGLLVVRRPWPSMLRTVWGDPERYARTYWSDVPGCYFTGDGARRDEDGYFWVMGRVDDVINVAGHRLGTMEVESALVAHPAVAEAAVVGRPDDLKGQAIVAFVTLKGGTGARLEPGEDARKALMAHVVTEIGAIARPDDIRFTDALPKTRSGKIMRRLLKEIAAGGETKGDTSTLEDISILARLRADDE